MSYLQNLASAASNGIGSAPPPQARNIGAPPAAQPHIEAAPYDVALDPGWKGIVDPNDHMLRNFLNGISPEERQMLLQRLMQGKPGSPVGAPGGAPPQMPSPVPAAATPTPGI